MSDLPVIAGIEITTDAEGRFSLNALHKASGLGESKEPNKWLSLKGTSELINALEATEESCGSAVNITKGGNSPGTYAHKLLAISYAGWISPAFQLQVNQVFLDYKAGRLQLVQPKALATDTVLNLPACIESIKSLFPSLAESSLQALAGDICEIDLGRRLIPSPVIKDKFYAATELAEENGVSAQKVGRIATAFGLKTEEFGEYRLSKSKYSTKQVEQFYYNEKGRLALAMLFAETVS